MWPRLVNIAIGIWLMAAPDVIGYGGMAANHDRLIGPLLASIACIAAWEATRPLRWINLVIGLWMLLAPFALGFPAAAMINTAGAGVAVAALSLVRGRQRHRFGGGWSALWKEPTATSSFSD